MARLREAGAVPGIIISGYSDEIYRTRSKQAGFDEYLVKPIDLSTLGEHVAKLLRDSAKG